MKKLSEYKDEEALELLADIIEPLTEIFSDKEVREAIKGKGKKSKIVAVAIRNHKSEVLEIMARLDGVEPSEYHINVLTLPIKVLEVLNDKDLTSFLESQGQNMVSESFGSAMENTKEEESKDSSIIA